MNYTFKGLLFGKPWTLLDDKIIVGKKEYSFTQIASIDQSHTPKNSGQNGIFDLKLLDGKSYMLLFPYKQKSEAFEAFEYLKKKIKEQNEERTKELEAELRDLFGEEADDLISWMNDTEPKETRMRCNVCGKIFCYTDADLQANISHQKWAKVHAVGSLFGTSLDMYGQSNQMQAELDKIVDYSRCPNCKSTNLTDISKEKAGEAAATPPTQTTTTSAADELKKFKELLDMDVITQEEFDAKKKQLLGL